MQSERRPSNGLNHQVWVLLLLCSVLALTGCSHFYRGSSGFLHAGHPLEQVKVDTEAKIRRHYDSGEPDSALVAVRELEETTGPRDVTYRINLLLQIAEGTLSEDSYDRNVIENILRFQADQSFHSGGYSSWLPPVDRSLEPFAARVAAEQAAKVRPGTVAHLLSECFSGACDSLFLKLQRPEFAQSRLLNYRDDELREIRKNRLDGHFAIYSGIWRPSKGAKELGGHPILGTVMGGSVWGYIYNLALEGRFLNSPEQYVVERGDRLDTTDSFIGWYSGFEFGRDLVRTGHHDVFARVGAGIDGFAYEDPDGGKVKRKINSFNLNYGLGYRYHLRWFGLNYIGVEGIQNHPFYDRKAGGHLDGSVFSLRVLVGWYGNGFQAQRQRALTGRS